MKKYVISIFFIIVIIFIFAFWMANIHRNNTIAKNETNNNNLNIATTNSNNLTNNTNVNDANNVTNIVENTTNNNNSNTYNSTSNTSTFNSYEVDSNEDEVSPYYKRTVGVNGTINYACTRKCNESCPDCDSCIRKAKSFPKSGTKCNFTYQIPKKAKDIGWIGCPQCGDITYDEWWDFYNHDNF